MHFPLLFNTAQLLNVSKAVQTHRTEKYHVSWLSLQNEVAAARREVKQSEWQGKGRVLTQLIIEGWEQASRGLAALVPHPEMRGQAASAEIWSEMQHLGPTLNQPSWTRIYVLTRCLDNSEAQSRLRNTSLCQSPTTRELRKCIRNLTFRSNGGTFRTSLANIFQELSMAIAIRMQSHISPSFLSLPFSSFTRISLLYIEVCFLPIISWQSMKTTV